MANEMGTNVKKLGVVLGGGGARGLAHIGVIKVLEESSISISYLAGCSMGGLIASLLSTGLSINEIEKIARRFSNTREILKLVDRTPSRKGLLAGKNIRKFLSKYIPDDFRMENTAIPLTLNAVDLISGEEIELREGILLDNMMATTAVPGFFPPVEIGAYRLVDGGMLDDVPVKFLKNSPADVILAIDVHQLNDAINQVDEKLPYEHIPLPLPPFVHDFYRAEMIMTTTLIKLNLEKYPPDILVAPMVPSDVSLFFGFLKINEIIQAGEQAMREKLPTLLALLHG